MVYVMFYLHLIPPTLLAIAVALHENRSALAWIALGLLSPYLVKLSLKMKRSEVGGIDHLYNLQHMILNLDVPPRTMWMNMGYWKDTDNFPTACENLFLNVLEEAGLKATDSRSRTVLDIGIGCGDSTLALMGHGRQKVDSQDNFGRHNLLYFDDYTGLTVNSAQLNLAKHRVSKYTVNTLKPHLNDTNDTSSKSPLPFNIRLYHQDASDPSTYEGLLTPFLTNNNNTSNPPSSIDKWILAIDSLYHFQPSRLPIFTYAANHSISIAAFDLFLSPDITPLNRLILRFVCLGLSAPCSNFKTIDNYKNDLVRVGYSAKPATGSEPDSIRIVDITEHVFPGLVDFLGRRDEELKILGLGSSFTRFLIARKVFKWFARGDIIRAGIVVARKKEKEG